MGLLGGQTLIIAQGPLHLLCAQTCMLFPDDGRQKLNFATWSAVFPDMFSCSAHVIVLALSVTCTLV